MQEIRLRWCVAQLVTLVSGDPGTLRGRQANDEPRECLADVQVRAARDRVVRNHRVHGASGRTQRVIDSGIAPVLVGAVAK